LLSITVDVENVVKFETFFRISGGGFSPVSPPLRMPLLASLHIGLGLVLVLQLGLARVS